MSAVHEQLGPSQFSRLIYGAIIGLALTVALEHEEPGAAVMAGTLVGTGVAVGLAELYSEFLGTEVSTRRRVDRARFREIAANLVALVFGASFPASFFLGFLRAARLAWPGRSRKSIRMGTRRSKVLRSWLVR